MPHNDRPRLVVAEDDEAVLDLLRTRLTIAGYDVAYARDGYEALEVIRQVRPAAVVLDLNMPRLDGFGVLEALWAKRQVPGLPVMVLTARHSADDVKRCIALGAKDYLAKPFGDRTLLARVERLLRAPKPRLSAEAAASQALAMLD